MHAPSPLAPAALALSLCAAHAAACRAAPPVDSSKPPATGRDVGAPAAPARDFAPGFGETHHGFTTGVPTVVSVEDRLVGARYDEQSRLTLEPDGGRIESHVLRWPRPFNELLVSWNVDVPRGAGFYVEVQVGSEARGWSPWLYLGDWGRGLPPERRTTAFEGGEVAIDVFRSSQLYDRARYRITALPGETDEPVVVVQTALCFSDTTRLSDIAPGVPRTGDTPLAVPARTQKDEDEAIAMRVCSPTSVAMVLEHHGVDVPTPLVAAAIYDREHDIYGNWPRAVQAAWTHGVPGSLVRISSWRAAEHFLRAGVPLIISIRAERGQLRDAPYAETNGHLLVLLGFDAEGRAIVNDPAAARLEEVRRAYFHEDLEQVWMRNGGVAYALGPGPSQRGRQ